MNDSFYFFQYQVPRFIMDGCSTDASKSNDNEIKTIKSSDPHQLQSDIAEHSSDTDSSNENTEEEIYRNKFLILSDCDKLVGSSEPTSEVEDSITSPPVPVDAVINVQQTGEKTTALTGGARPKRQIKGAAMESRAANSSADSSEDEVTPIQQNMDFIRDLDQIADSGASRPGSLSLPRPLGSAKTKRMARSDSDSSSWSELYASRHGSTEALIEAASNTPLHTQGTVIKEGEMIAFIAEDLSEKIRMSSPHGSVKKGDV